MCGHCMEKVLIVTRGRGRVTLTEDGRYRHRCNHVPWEGRAAREVRRLCERVRRDVTRPGSTWPSA